MLERTLEKIPCPTEVLNSAIRFDVFIFILLLNSQPYIPIIPYCQ
jgi:hypothetical protein